MKSRLPFAAVMRRLSEAQGFTLVELMFTTACQAIILTAVLSTFLFLLRQFGAISNYVDIHQQAANAVGQFTRDMREVSNVGSFTAGSLQVSIPTTYTGTGNIGGTKTVTYTYTNGALYRLDSTVGITKLLVTNLSSLTVALSDKGGTNTTVVTNAKGAQMILALSKTVLGKTNSEQYISGRIDMRNTQ